MKIIMVCDNGSGEENGLWTAWILHPWFRTKLTLVLTTQKLSK